jgi:hypothetical protein
MSDVQEKLNPPAVARQRLGDDVDLSQSLTVYIDDVISRFSKKSRGVDRFYRIGRAPVGVYATERKSPNHAGSRILPGDIVVDRALWSTTVDVDVLLLIVIL